MTGHQYFSAYMPEATGLKQAYFMNAVFDYVMHANADILPVLEYPVVEVETPGCDEAGQCKVWRR